MATEWLQLTRRSYSTWELGISDIFLDFRTLRSVIEALDDRVTTNETTFGSYLPLAGGTMSGNIVMDGNDITKVPLIDGPLSGNLDLKAADDVVIKPNSAATSYVFSSANSHLDCNQNSIVDVADVEGENGLAVPMDGVTEDARTSYVNDWHETASGTDVGMAVYNSQVICLGGFGTALARDAFGIVHLPNSVVSHATSNTCTITWWWWTNGTDTTNVNWQWRMFAIDGGETFGLTAKYNSGTATGYTPSGTNGQMVESTVTTGALDWTAKDSGYGIRVSRRGDIDTNTDNAFLAAGVRFRWNGDING